jgi:hypothetical protein
MWRALKPFFFHASSKFKCRVRVRTVLILFFALVVVDALNVFPLSFILHRFIGLPRACQSFEFDETMRLRFFGPDLVRETIEQYTVRLCSLSFSP